MLLNQNNFKLVLVQVLCIIASLSFTCLCVEADHSVHSVSQEVTVETSRSKLHGYHIFNFLIL